MQFEPIQSTMSCLKSIYSPAKSAKDLERRLKDLSEPFNAHIKTAQTSFLELACTVDKVCIEDCKKYERNFYDESFLTSINDIS